MSLRVTIYSGFDGRVLASRRVNSLAEYLAYYDEMCEAYGDVRASVKDRT